MFCFFVKFCISPYLQNNTVKTLISVYTYYLLINKLKIPCVTMGQ